MLNTISRYINDNYGSRRGLLAWTKFCLLQGVGYRRELKDIDFCRVKKLVFVCSGNICRSPLAAFYSQHLGLDAESYGLHTRGGDSADSRTVAVAKILGIDLSPHITRHIRDYRPHPDHLVVAMEPAHIEALRTVTDPQAQLTLAPLWLHSPRLYLHDPFGSNPAHFEKSAKKIIEALDNLKERIDEHS